MNGTNIPTGPYYAGAGFAGPPAQPGMTIGQTLDRIFKLFKTHGRLYMSIGAVMGLMLAAVVAIAMTMTLVFLLPRLKSNPAHFDPHVMYGLFAPFMLLYLAMFPVYALFAAAVSTAVVRTNMGEAVTFGQAWERAREHAGRYIWLLFLMAVIVSGPFYALIAVVAVIAAALGGFAHGGAPDPMAMFFLVPLMLLLYLGSMLYMVFALLYVCMAFPACVTENLTAVQALKRSVALTRKAKGRIFVVMLVVYAATYAIMLVAEMVFFFFGVMALLAASAMHMTLRPATAIVLAVPAALGLVLLIVATIAFSYAAYATAIGVLYCDQRLRIDGANAPAAGGASA